MSRPGRQSGSVARDPRGCGMEKTSAGNGNTDAGGAGSFDILAGIFQHTGREPAKKPSIFTDTTEFMDIDRDDVIRINNKHFYILGNCVEGRFGIDDHPKFWVKSAIDLDDGSKKIVKLAFQESFTSRIGPFNFTCIRSSEKESFLLELTRGDRRFMQGYTLIDSGNNRVRVIDKIEGANLFSHILSLDIPHEKYFFEVFPDLLRKFISSVEAVAFLHANSVCHGDVRMDHIIIDKNDSSFRWIDFDFKQYSLDYDVWCFGNLLMFLVGKGEITFHLAERGVFGDPVRFRLNQGDASSIFPQRIANLKKIFPYIPGFLNFILMRYSKEAEKNLFNYKTVLQLLADLNNIEL